MGRPLDDDYEMRKRRRVIRDDMKGAEPAGDDPGSEASIEVIEHERNVETGPEGAPDPETERLAREIAALRDQHLRLAAEFDNYRKRSQLQLGESSTRAQAVLASGLLDVLDDFDRVVAFDRESATFESVLEGITLVQRKLRQFLEGMGLEEIDPAGAPFDPNFMEAMLRVEASSEEEDDTVGQVFQRGFRFRGHLLRPARVSVRKLE